LGVNPQAPRARPLSPWERARVRAALEARSLGIHLAAHGRSPGAGRGAALTRIPRTRTNPEDEKDSRR
jgi:hypothetical protein